MARFEPFPAIRYDPSRVELAQVVAPPYDVLSESDRAQLAARDPHNIVRIDVPLERHGAARYDAAAATLRTWLDEGVLLTDAEPSFYLERMTFDDEAGARPHHRRRARRARGASNRRRARCSPTSRPRRRPAPIGSS